jgi:hypothetical protein
VILKEEANRISGEVLSLAKWKLVAVGATALTVLGWSKDARPGKPAGFLLASAIGLLCAYVDWLYYHRLTTINLIRSYVTIHEDTGAKEVTLYECYVRDCRDNKDLYFWSQARGNFLATLFFSAGLPLVAVLRYGLIADDCFLLLGVLVVVILGITANIALYVRYVRVRRGLWRDADAQRSTEVKK